MRNGSGASTRSPKYMSELLARLKAYRAQMAPHNRSREGGKLLLESIDEIERLERLLAEKDETATTFMNQVKDLQARERV